MPVKTVTFGRLEFLSYHRHTECVVFVVRDTKLRLALSNFCGVQP
jgi:hypothetical protein